MPRLFAERKGDVAGEKHFNQYTGVVTASHVRCRPLPRGPCSSSRSKETTISDELRSAPYAQFRHGLHGWEPEHLRFVHGYVRLDSGPDITPFDPHEVKLLARFHD